MSKRASRKQIEQEARRRNVIVEFRGGDRAFRHTSVILRSPYRQLEQDVYTDLYRAMDELRRFPVVRA